VASTRLAVRRAVADLPPGALVLVACSGGADSLALAAATAFVAPRRALRAGLLTVDHGWYEQSGAHAERVADDGRALRLSPVEVLTAHSARSEGAARDARRGALLAAAERLGAAALLTGHTLDDQAETVLLRLARGSGARSLGAMTPCDGLLRRPLLGLRRAQTRAACLAEGLTPWDDPTNADPSFTRARARHTVLPVLERELGPGIAESLARSAELLRADAAALDTLADAAYGRLVRADPGRREPTDAGAGVELSVAALTELPAALRTRVLRRAALTVGAAPSALRAEHIWSIDELATRWRGQKLVPLPSGVTVRRRGDRIALVGPGPTGPGGVARLGGATRPAAPPGHPATGATPAGRARPPTAHPDNQPDPQHAEPRSGNGPEHRGGRRTEPVTMPVTGPWTAPDAEEDMQVSQAGVSTPDSSERRATEPTLHPDVGEVLVSAEEIAERIADLAARVDADYAGREILLVGVLKGAVMVMADLSRALSVPLTMEFMAVSSYGSATSSSGVVRILKDLDRSIEDRDVLVVEDIIDSGLTLSWLLKNLRSRNPASLEVLALFRKPEAIAVDVDVRYVGFDIPSAFVVGYGLDYDEYYRTLPYVGTLTPAAIARGARH
jgi:hypoxanthine phosphoribosyltransferase